MVLLRIFFTLTIFLPSLLVYAHELSHHEHEVCEETNTHFHHVEEPCPVDDFVLKTSYIAHFPSTKLALPFHYNQVLYPSFFVEKHDINQIFYRGPPTDYIFS